MAESLKKQTIKGSIWSGIDNVAHMGVAFVVSVILARILTPDDYGLLGIILIFTTISTTILNAGFTNALIRKPDATEDDYNTSFIVNMGLSIFFYSLIFFMAPFVAVFFGRNELITLTRVVSIGIIIGAFSMIQQTRLTKRLDFRTQTKITFVASLVSGMFGIMLALLDFGVWSLVYQQISMQLLKTIMLFISDKWYPKFHVSKKSFNELFGFGWKMMLSALLDAVWKELYQVVVGKFYNSATLGQYTRSKQFSQLFSSNLTAVIQRVTFPVLSNIQDEKERMTSAYRRIIKITMFVTTICMFLLGAISEPLLFCLIGPKWHEAAIYLPLICINGSLYPLHAINLNMLQVSGRSDLFLGLEVLKKFLAVGPLLVGVTIGIIPMLYTNFFAGVIAYFLNSYYSGKFIGYSSWMQIKDIAPSVIIAAVVSVLVFFLKYLPISFWIILPLQIFLGISLFFIFCKMTKSEEFTEVIGIVRPLFKRF